MKMLFNSSDSEYIYIGQPHHAEKTSIIHIYNMKQKPQPIQMWMYCTPEHFLQDAKCFTWIRKSSLHTTTTMHELECFFLWCHLMVVLKEVNVAEERTLKNQLNPELDCAIRVIKRCYTVDSHPTLCVFMCVSGSVEEPSTVNS